MLELNDTIVAIAVPLNGAARGILRISGPQAVEVSARCFESSDARPIACLVKSTVLAGQLHTRLHEREICTLPCDAYVWPGTASYTRQPTVELHTLGSPPLLQAALRTLCESGGRLAEPGEFTLRAFLAGRLDLTQAEAVLGVIDARGESALQTALQQLAGGLSQPLALLRSTLLDLLADLEAGLDFVDEDIEFIGREEIRRRTEEACRVVQAIVAQLHSRGEALFTPRAVLVGPTNSGKSSLFNALVKRFGTKKTQPALVSNIAGTTRDYLIARLLLDGVECEIVDTAGEDVSLVANSIAAHAQQTSRDQGQRADLLLHCLPATGDPLNLAAPRPFGVKIVTKCDLQPSIVEGAIITSSVTGKGLDELAAAIADRLKAPSAATHAGAVATTSARCADSLHSALDGLVRARNLVAESAGEELIAAELRNALHHLGSVVGAVYTDDILDEIFGRFCIGK